jgi:hypothetical protein
MVIVNPDRNIKNSIHIWIHAVKEMWHLGAKRNKTRGLSDCVEGS